MSQQSNLPQIIEDSKQAFVSCMEDTKSLDLVANTSAAFEAAIIVNRLKEVLTNEVMETVFKPLAGLKIGFRTDKTYSNDIIRNCIIDAAVNGLLPTGNQFNIIAGNMYPTKEGYTALLSKLKQSAGLKYLFEFDIERVINSADPQYVAIPCKITYSSNAEPKGSVFKYVSMVKSNGPTSTTDQLRGKAERKCKKAFFEFLTGLDLGDGDAETIDVPYQDVTGKPTPKTALERAREINARSMAPNTQFDQSSELTDEEKAEIERQEMLDFQANQQ